MVHLNPGSLLLFVGKLTDPTNAGAINVLNRAQFTYLFLVENFGLVE